MCRVNKKIPQRRQWRRSGIFIVNFEHAIAGWVRIWLFRVSNVAKIHRTGKSLKDFTMGYDFS